MTLHGITKQGMCVCLVTNVSFLLFQVWLGGGKGGTVLEDEELCLCQGAGTAWITHLGYVYITFHDSFPYQQTSYD